VKSARKGYLSKSIVVQDHPDVSFPLFRIIDKLVDLGWEETIIRMDETRLNGE
jgi:hypothetical protein